MMEMCYITDDQQTIKRSPWFVKKCCHTPSPAWRELQLKIEHYKVTSHETSRRSVAVRFSAQSYNLKSARSQKVESRRGMHNLHCCFEVEGQGHQASQISDQ